MTDIAKGLAFCLGYGEKRTPSLPLQQFASGTGNDVLPAKPESETTDNSLDNSLSSELTTEVRANLASNPIDKTSLSHE